MNDRVNAMRDYQAAIELDETYSLAYFNAGNVYFHSRQFSQVRNIYTYTQDTGIHYTVKPMQKVISEYRSYCE